MSATAPENSTAPSQSAVFTKTAAYFTTFVILGLAVAVIGPTLPGFAERTSSKLNQVSILFVGLSIGYLTGSLFGGRQYDRLPGHRLAGGALLLLVAVFALTPFIPLLWLLTVLLIILGFAEAILDVGGNTMLVWLHGKRVPPYMNGLHFAFGFGAFISPIIVAQVILNFGDLSWVYWILAILALPVAVWLLRIPSPNAPPPEPAGSSRIADARLVALLATFFFLVVGAESAMGGWIFVYANQQFGGELSGSSAANFAAIAAYLTSAYWGALTLGRLLGIPISTRFKSRTILFVDLLGCLVSALIILIFPTSWVVLWIGTIGSGLFMASIFPTALNLAERRMALKGDIMRWFFVGSSLGGMVLPWIIGQLIVPIGTGTVIVGMTISLLLAIVVFYLILRFSTASSRTDSTL